MKHLLVLPLVAATLFSSILFSSAAPAAPSGLPRDVPPGHWAGSSVGRIVHQNIMGTMPDGRFKGDQPVTRYELAVVLDRFVRYMESARKPLHAEIVQPSVKVPASANAVQRQALTHLVSNGFLPPTSPLLSSGSKLVTANELSAALAFVTIKLSDRAEAPQKY